MYQVFIYLFIYLSIYLFIYFIILPPCELVHAFSSSADFLCRQNELFRKILSGVPRLVMDQELQRFLSINDFIHISLVSFLLDTGKQ